MIGRLLLTVLAILVAQGGLTGMASAQNDGAKSKKDEESKYRIRRIFVPEGDLEKVILGRYFPIELSKLNELLKKANTNEVQPTIQSVQLQMEWDPSSGLTGTCVVELDRELWGSQLLFDSSFQLNNVQCLDSEFGFPVLGKTIDGRYSFSASAGKRFQFDVALADSSVMKGRRLSLPKASHHAVFIRVPDRYRLISSSRSSSLTDVAAAGAGEGVEYYLDLANSVCEVSVIAEEDRKSLVVTQDELEWASKNVLWKLDVEVPIETLAKSQFEFLVDDKFECLSVSVAGSPIEFVTIARGNGKSAIRVENPGVTKTRLAVEIKFRYSIGSSSQLQFRPIEIANTLVRSSLRILPSNAWEIRSIDPDNYAFVQIGDSGSTRMVQNGNEAAVGIRFQKSTREINSEALELDFQNDKLFVRQLIVNLQENGVVELGNDWEVQTVIDVQQDDLPIPFVEKQATTGRILAIENESRSVWVVATRDVDSVTRYRCEDFVPAKVGLENCRVDFKNGFLSRFVDGVESSTGIPGTTEQNGTQWFEYSSLGQLVFQLAADVRQFQSSFDSVVQVDVGSQNDRVDYSISWNSAENRRVIVELNSGKLLGVSFEGPAQGNFRQLNAAEKRRLALSVNRLYWIFEVPPTDDSPSARVNFSLGKNLVDSKLDVQLPQPLGNTKHVGLLKVSNSGVGDSEVDAPLIELALQTRKERVFQFGNESQIRISQVRPASIKNSVEFQVISNSAEIVDQKSFLQEVKLVVRIPAVLGSVADQPRMIVAAEDASIKKITLRAGDKRYTGKKVEPSDPKSDWYLTIPRSSSELTHAVLEIAAVNDAPWNKTQLGIPEVQINGSPIRQECTVAAGNQWQLVDLNQVLTSGLEENIGNFAWLPSLGFDTATSERFIGEQSELKAIKLNPGQRVPLVFLVPRMIVTMFAIVLLGIFIAIALSLKRNRQVLFGCLFFLLLVFVLGGLYGLFAAMAFWGFTIGLIMRELNRLCKFSATGTQAVQRVEQASSRVGIILIASVLFCASGAAQEESGKAKEKSDKKSRRKDVAAFIPIDSANKPTGIAYLPAEIYELLSEQKKSKSTLLAQNSSLEILSDTDSRSLAAIVRFEMIVDEPRRYLLPLLIDGAIYDSNAVKSDSATLVFRPVEGKGIEVEFKKSGKQSVEIGFLVPLRNKTGVGIKVPFGTAVEFFNRSDLQYAVQKNGVSNSSSGQSSRLPSGAAKTLESGPEFTLVPANRMDNALTVLELLDLSKYPAERKISLLAKEAIEKTLVFSVGKQWSLKSGPDGLRRSGSEFELSSWGQEELELSVEANIKVEPGQLAVESFLSSSHPVEKHLLVIRGNENYLMTANLDELPDFDLARKFGSLESLNLKNDFDQALELNDDSPVQLWFKAKRQQSSCLAEHHYFLFERRVVIKSEFSFSNDSPLQVLRFELPVEIENAAFKMGDRKLNWIRNNENEITVFANLDQPGRYLVEMEGQFRIQGNNVKFLEPRSLAGFYESSSLFWTNRRRLIDESLPKDSELVLDSDSHLFAGKMSGGNHILKTLPNPGFPELKIGEKIQFLPGKTTHRFTIDFADFRSGQWVGIELPRGSDLTQLQRNILLNEWGAVIEDPSVLAARQVWIPLVDTETREFVMEFDQMIEGNRVEFAQVINCQSFQRQINLPERINENEVEWTINDGMVISSGNDRIVWEVNQKKSVAQFQLRDDGIEPMSVRFAETSIDQSMQKISCRFYITPGDQRTADVALPNGYIVESIRICGMERSWTSPVNDRLQVQLLNNRFFQVVDLVAYTDGKEKASSKVIELPTILGVADYQVYLQNDSNWSIDGFDQASMDSLRAARVAFAESAINNFELDLDNAEGWQSVLVAWIEFVLADQELPDELKQRLDNLPADNSDSELEYVTTLPGVCQSGREIFQCTAPTVVLVAPETGKRSRFQLEILVGIAGLGLLTLVTVRLPHWFRAPVFSFVLISLIWVFGVTWISITPESIFAWCWLLFASLFVVLVIIDAVLKIRAYFEARAKSQEMVSVEGSQTTQPEGSRTASQGS